ncbi:PKD domain-containing protein, partial [bacterium]|nr:PKD domain-containing protein [bacterium]
MSAPSGSPVRINEDNSLAFNGSASGGSGTYTYSWDFATLAPPSSSQNPGSISFPDPGTYTITLTVSDTAGHSATDTVQIIVLSGPSSDLEARIESPMGTTLIIFEDTPVDFDGYATGGSGQYTYSWTFDGAAPPSSSSDPVSITFTEAAIYTILFTVSDSQGYSSTDAFQVIVLDDDPPPPTVLQAGIVSPADTTITIYQGNSVNFQGSATGGNGSYTYSWDFDDAAADSNVPNPGTIAFMEADTYNIRFTVTDSAGHSSTDTVHVVVLPGGDISKVNQDLIIFANDPTDEHYNTLMNDIASLNNSSNSNLYRALAELLGLYSDPLLGELAVDLGLPAVGFETDFDQLGLAMTPEVINNLVYTYMLKQIYTGNTEDVLAEFQTRLENVDNLLAQSYGIDLRVYGSDFSYANFDNIDIDVLRSFTNLLKAAVIYLQAVNVEVTDYNVSYDGVPCDIRDLLTGLGSAPVRDEDDDEIMDATMSEFIANNPNVLKYKPGTTRLSEFRNAYGDALNFYTGAVNALAGLSEDARRNRNTNAFNLDTDLDMEMAKMMRDHTLPQFRNCMAGSGNQFQVLRDEETFGEYVNGGDGFYYKRELHDLYLDTVVPNSSRSTITIFNLLGSGTKTPRDMILEIANLPEEDDDLDDEEHDYEPYYIPAESTNPYLEDVEYYDWEEPIETFTIPLEAITFDGAPYANSSQWAAIPTYKTTGDTSIKLARNSSGELFICVKTTFT